MRSALLRIFCTVVTSTAVLAIPTFAIVTLLTGSGAATVELPAGEDPIRSGFRVTSPREPASVAQAAVYRGDEAEEVVPTIWTFTDRGGASPWQGGGASTTTVLSSDHSSAGLHVSVKLTATVTGKNSSPPQLTVTFYDGSTALGTVTLTVGSKSSTATLTTSFGSAGKHNITAKYNGDYNDQPSTSNVVTITIG
jgi:hypothetical protein